MKIASKVDGRLHAARRISAAITAELSRGRSRLPSLVPSTPAPETGLTGLKYLYK